MTRLEITFTFPASDSTFVKQEGYSPPCLLQRYIRIIWKTIKPHSVDLHLSKVVFNPDFELIPNNEGLPV